LAVSCSHPQRASPASASPARAQAEESKELGWEDIQDIKSGSISHTILNYTLPSGLVERTIIYEAPWSKCDRVEDYRGVWEVFEKAQQENP
jgi:hypothetical protein